MSIMKKSFAVLAFFVLVTFCSCTKPSGVLVTKEFVIEGYTSLSVEDSFEVTVSDEVNKILVTTDDNIMPKVVVKIENNVLKIYLNSMVLSSRKHLEVVMPYKPDLKSVELSGASTFRSNYALTNQKVTVELSGSSEFYGDIESSDVKIDLSTASKMVGNVTASDLELDLSTASNATLTGFVTSLKLDLSGTSNLKKKIEGSRYALSCDKCRGEMSGASNAFIHCDNSIRVSLSGTSDLHYTGYAATTGSSTYGGSNIIHDVL